MPFVFAYAPTMLIMVPDFTLGGFLFVTLTCALGVLVLGVGLTGYAFTHMGLGSQLGLVLAALLMISPNGPLTAVGVALAAPVLALNWMRSRRALQPA